MRILFLLSILITNLACADILPNWKPQTLPAHLSYNQERYLASTKIVLKSSGNVFIEEDGSISWQQTKPFEVTYTIAKDSAFSQIKGQPKKPLNNPIIEKIIAIIDSSMKGKFNKLKHLFNIKNVNNHEIELTPKDALIAKAIKIITFNINKKSKTLRLIERSGNHLTLTFRLIPQ